jgi:peptidoglycan/LPS O-acetylase OafA/YrhL
MLSRYWSGRVSIGQHFDTHRGLTHGFDYLRIILAACVIGWHTIFTSYGSNIEGPLYASWIRCLIMPILPMFFALGGFLITASLFRSDTAGKFLFLRLIRIFPGLVVVVAFAAFILGPSLTTFTLKEYFLDSKFLAYWATVLGDVQFELPGVFSQNPARAIVNISLWTIPWEFGCCVVLAGVFLLKNALRPAIIVVGTITLSAVIPALAVMTHNEPTLFARPPGHLLALCFMPGVLFYVFRYQIPFSFTLFVLSLIMTLILFSKAKTSYLAPAFVTYMTVYLGLLHPPKFGPMKTADFSYGIYLYGFLIQQTFVDLFPTLRVWWLNWLVCLPLAAAFGACSWYFVELPMLKRKKQIYRFIQTRWIGLAGGLTEQRLRAGR